MSIAQLAALARRLNREAGAPAIPSLFFLTDPDRTPDPLAGAQRLPRGAAVIYRHFGAADRGHVARRLATLCRSRGLVLLVSADPELAARIGAAGVHWPEARLPAVQTPGFRLVTSSAHSAGAVNRASAVGANLCLLGPVFATRSAAGNAPLGVFAASQIARAAPLPIIPLGGVNPETAARLAGRGFAGLAAIDALADA